MKNILISGANEGIGYYTAKELLMNGNNVYVLDIKTENIDKLKSKYPNQLNVFICDVSKQEEVNKSIAYIEQIDIAIHNACKCTFDSFADTELQTFRQVLDVNYYGALNITKAVIPKMNMGKIMYVSSGVAVMGFENISPYACSKNAIESLAKCLNIEYKDKGITFHIIHPPLTSTRSASPLPIPNEMMKSPDEVGKGIAENLDKNSFIICHNFSQKIQTKLVYLFSIQFGKLFSKLTAEYKKDCKI